MKKVRIWTDGACKGNPGRGGWGALLKCGSHVKEIYGGEPYTTSQRMELRAVIEALQILIEKCEIQVFTDSSYVQKGMTEWIEGWKRRGWTTVQGNPVKNQELWKTLDKLSGLHCITWHWVKGHNGDEGNERADELANLGALG